MEGKKVGEERRGERTWGRRVERSGVSAERGEISRGGGRVKRKGTRGRKRC